MRIQSEPGKGTTIRLYLPRVFEDLDILVSSSRPSSFERGHETILVVDDEKALVDIVVSNLHELGYKTVVANDSKQALDILKTNDTIDLLFTDVIMPGKMDGYELSLSAQKLYPSLKILMSSGFINRNDQFDVSNGVINSTLLFKLLKKPYDKTSLSAAVRQVLDME